MYGITRLPAALATASLTTLRAGLLAIAALLPADEPPDPHSAADHAAAERIAGYRLGLDHAARGLLDQPPTGGGTSEHHKH